MRTALIDNSLSVFTLRDDVNPEHLYNYIKSLGEAGVKYVELDFRAAMKLHSLPTNIGCIFRVIDPMFMRLCEIFDFDYLHLGINDVKKEIKTDIPVILGFEAGETISPKAFHYANQLMEEKITAVRMRGSFPMMTSREAEEYILRLKNLVPVPIDICPMNGKKNALDTALKFAQGGVDSLTLTLGHTEKFCSIEDYFFTMLMVYDKLPQEYSISALCRAAVYQRYVFKNAGDKMSQILETVDRDIMSLTNADTGERVKLRARMKNVGVFYKRFISSLEKMADNSGIPDDIFGCLEEAIKRFDASLYNDDIMVNRRRTFLN